MKTSITPRSYELNDGHRKSSSSGATRQQSLRIGIALAGLQFGGCQINALDFARELTSRGHHVVTFAVYDTPVVSIGPLADRLGIALHVLPKEKNPFLQARHVANLIREHRLDIVHVFGAWLAAPATLALWSRPSTALVVTNWTMRHIRGLPPMTPLILGTRSLVEEATRAIRSAPVWLLEPPVDTAADLHDEQSGLEFRKRWSVSDATTLLVIVSRLDFDMKAEGIATAMRAMELWREPNCQLAVVGGGDAQQSLTQLAEKVNATLGWRAVFMTGALEDPSSAYSAADLVLGMGGAALRALAYQKPLVVLGEGGFSKPFTPTTVNEFLQNGFYGRGQSNDSVSALLTHVMSTLALALSSDLTLWGRNIVLTRFSLSNATDRLLSIYDVALEQTTKPRRSFDAIFISLRYLAGRARHAWDPGNRIANQGVQNDSEYNF